MAELLASPMQRASCMSASDRPQGTARHIMPNEGGIVMLNRWPAVLLIVGVIAGYVISGTSVKAQNDPLPVSVGEAVILRYP
jgi:hypothetical protein